MPLKWEFPGGKIEEGEQPRDALRRELDEELGIDARIGEEVARIRHAYKNGGTVELRFYVVQDFKGKLENRIFRDVRWAKRSELPSYDFLEADLGLLISRCDFCIRSGVWGWGWKALANIPGRSFSKLFTFSKNAVKAWGSYPALYMYSRPR